MRLFFRNYQAAKIIVICIALFYPVAAMADLPHIGFASLDPHKSFINKYMKNRDDIDEWVLYMEHLAEESFVGKYTATRAILDKIQIRLIPKALRSSGKSLLPENEEEVIIFHNNVKEKFDKYLQKIAQENNAKLIIFDQISELHFKNFFQNNKSNKLLFKIIVYYAESNSMGFDYIELDANYFQNPLDLKEKLERGINKALEDAILSLGGERFSGAITDNESASDSASEPNSFDYSVSNEGDFFD